MVYILRITHVIVGLGFFEKVHLQNSQIQPDFALLTSSWLKFPACLWRCSE